MRLLLKTVFAFFILYSILMFYIILTYRPVTLNELKSCVSGSECIQVKAGCCGCAEGGEDTCVNADYKARWENSLEAECSGIMCAQVYNCPVASCACINGTCVFQVTG